MSPWSAVKTIAVPLVQAQLAQAGDQPPDQMIDQLDVGEVAGERAAQLDIGPPAAGAVGPRFERGELALIDRLAGEVVAAVGPQRNVVRVVAQPRTPPAPATGRAGRERRRTAGTAGPGRGCPGSRTRSARRRRPGTGRSARRRSPSARARPCAPSASSRPTGATACRPGTAAAGRPACPAAASARRRRQTGPGPGRRATCRSRRSGSRSRRPSPGRRARRAAGAGSRSTPGSCC